MGIEWQSWFECGNLWDEYENMTAVDFQGQMGFLEGVEVDLASPPGRCSNQIVISPDETTAGDDDVKQYETSCTLASNKGGNDKDGGKTISLKITLLGDCPL